MGFLIDPTMQRIKDDMRLILAEQSVINQNIANANNPKYVAQSFDRILQKTVERQNVRVVMEEELKALGENAAKYSADMRLLNFKMNVARTIATQGRR